jgi:hypothetical protein
MRRVFAIVMVVGVFTVVMMLVSYDHRGVLVIKMWLSEKMNGDVTDVSGEQRHDEQPSPPAWTSRRATSVVGAQLPHLCSECRRAGSGVHSGVLTASRLPPAIRIALMKRGRSQSSSRKVSMVVVCYCGLHRTIDSRMAHAQLRYGL